MKNKKELTLNDIAELIEKKTTSIKNEIVREIKDDTRKVVKDAVEELAMMTKKGFDAVDEKMESEVGNLAMITKKGFDEMGERINKVEKKLAERIEKIEGGQLKIVKRLDHVEGMLDDMDVKLDNRVRRFEFERLEKRVMTSSEK